MKNLNESIGLVGTNRGMSNSSGDSTPTFDPETDSAVISAKKQLDLLVDLKNQKYLRKAELETNITNWRGQLNALSDSFRNCNGECSGILRPVCLKHCEMGYLDGTAPINAKINDAQSEIDTITNTDFTSEINALTTAYQAAKTAAIKANNKKIEGEIKKIQADALTDPDALRAKQELERLKQEGEQALAKQKIEAHVAKNKSSNIKIYVIVGAVVLGLIAIAGIWIWLKSRKAV